MRGAAPETGEGTSELYLRVTLGQRDGSGKTNLLTSSMAPPFLPEGALTLPASFSVGKKSLGILGFPTYF